MEQNRLSHSARTAILLAILAMLAACEKSIIDEDLQSPNSLLQIRTRTGDADAATVAYPVQVYVFQNDICRAVQTIADDGQSAELTLMSPDETTCVGTEAAVTAALATLGTAAVSGWELPTKSQMQLVEAKLLSDDASLSGAFYLFRKSDNGIGYHKLGGTSWTTVPNTTTAYRLRPVALVTVAKE